MSDLALDRSDNDLLFENGDVVFFPDTREERRNATRQRLYIKLSIFLSEWFLDPNFGFDYYNFVLVKNPNLLQVETLMRGYILATPRVTEIIEFNLESVANTRTLTATFSVETLDGIVEGEI